MPKLILALALAAPLLAACEKPIPKPPKPVASALIAPVISAIAPQASTKPPICQPPRPARAGMVSYVDLTQSPKVSLLGGAFCLF
jgi:hypothetical protein